MFEETFEIKSTSMSFLSGVLDFLNPMGFLKYKEATLGGEGLNQRLEQLHP